MILLPIVCNVDGSCLMADTAAGVVDPTIRASQMPYLTEVHLPYGQIEHTALSRAVVRVPARRDKNPAFLRILSFPCTSGPFAHTHTLPDGKAFDLPE